MFSNSKYVQMLGSIGELLTNERAIFIKYKIIWDPMFGMCLKVKVRLDCNVCAWFKFGQVICYCAKIYFQRLKLVKNGVSFINSN